MNVDIKVVGDMLTIKGWREEKSETKKTDYLRREIRYSSFERSIMLPNGIKADDLRATYRRCARAYRADAQGSLSEGRCVTTLDAHERLGTLIQQLSAKLPSKKTQLA